MRRIDISKFTESISSGQLDPSKKVALEHAMQELFGEDLTYLYVDICIEDQSGLAAESGAFRLLNDNFMESVKNAHDAGATYMDIGFSKKWDREARSYKITITISDNGKAFPEGYEDGTYYPLAKSSKKQAVGGSTEDAAITGGANLGLRDSAEVCERNGGKLEIITGRDPAKPKAIILSSDIPKVSQRPEEKGGVFTLAQLHQERDSKVHSPTGGSGGATRRKYADRLRDRVMAAETQSGRAADIPGLLSTQQVETKQPTHQSSREEWAKYCSQESRLEFLQKIPAAIEAQQKAFPVGSLPAVDPSKRTSHVSLLSDPKPRLVGAMYRASVESGTSGLCADICNLKRDLEQIPEHERTADENFIIDVINKYQKNPGKTLFAIPLLIDTITEMNNNYSKYKSENPAPSSVQSPTRRR